MNRADEENLMHDGEEFQVLSPIRNATRWQWIFPMRVDSSEPCTARTIIAELLFWAASVLIIGGALVGIIYTTSFTDDIGIMVGSWVPFIVGWIFLLACFLMGCDNSFVVLGPTTTSLNEQA